MTYIYPKFSKYELPGLRLGGAGLGNLLFIYARAIVLSQNRNLRMIWPTWPSLKIGPWIRKESDKRFYNDLFKNKGTAIDGLKKCQLLMTHRKINYIDVIDNWEVLKDDDILIYDMFEMNFRDLLEYRELIVNNILTNLGEKGEKALDFNAGQAINVHIRLGDFANNTVALDNGNNNVRIPVRWYIETIRKVREVLNREIAVNIFSDGTEKEIAPLLHLNNIQRVTFGNSIADIIALSRAPLIIASGSSFSLWARYIGNCSSISYPNQMKDRVYSGDKGFEIVLGEEERFVGNIKNKLHNLYYD